MPKRCRKGKKRSKKRTARSPRYGYFGTTSETREGTTVIDHISESFAYHMRGGNTTPVEYRMPGEIHDWRTVDGENKKRLEEEIGAPFVSRDWKERP